MKDPKIPKPETLTPWCFLRVEDHSAQSAAGTSLRVLAAISSVPVGRVRLPRRLWGSYSLEHA